jgi:exosortase/archaeosortase family protein
MKYLNNKKVRIKQNEPIRFAITFIVLFLIFYYFNIFFFGITSPGNLYSPFLANHLNYIQGLRWLLLCSTAQILKLLGFSAIFNNYELLVGGRGAIRVVYTCLGLGVLSFFTAFVLSYPKCWKSKIIFLTCGIFTIEFLNILRFVILSLFWNKQTTNIIDHHTIFNILIYIIISISLYFWVKSDFTINK